MQQLWSKRTGLILILATVFLSGCIYSNVEVPRAYRSASPIDVESKYKKSDKTVKGEGCNKMVLFSVAWGNGGYAAAVNHALENEPPGSILYDVHTDVKAESYFIGVYSKVCTVVTGKVASP